MKFVSNLKSDTHCFQASLKMVLSVLLPSESFSFSKLDNITGHSKKFWTYPYKTELWLARKGFKVVHHESFPVEHFIQKGEGFLKNYWDSGVYDLQKQYSNFRQEQKHAKRALESGLVKYINKPAGVDEIVRYKKQGYIVMVRVNPFSLRGEKGNGSHVVVVFESHKNNFVVHDPGLPPRPGLKVSRARMAKAMWGNNSLIMAIRRN